MNDVLHSSAEIFRRYRREWTFRTCPEITDGELWKLKALTAPISPKFAIFPNLKMIIDALFCFFVPCRCAARSCIRCLVSLSVDKIFRSQTLAVFVSKGNRRQIFDDNDSDVESSSVSTTDEALGPEVHSSALFI